MFTLPDKAARSRTARIDEVYARTKTKGFTAGATASSKAFQRAFIVDLQSSKLR